jgi:hypothetical protein
MSRSKKKIWLIKRRDGGVIGTNVGSEAIKFEELGGSND